MIELSIFSHTRLGNTGLFDLPPSIIRLVRLKQLSVQRCRSLPVEFSKLQHLNCLHLDACSSLILNFPFEMELGKLEMFLLESTSLPESISSPFFVWLTTKVPSLTELGFSEFHMEDASRIVDFLLAVEETSFKDNLKSLIVYDCNLGWESFETSFQSLMLDILPRFPNLDSMRLNGNKIESIQPIAEKFETEQTVVSSLRVLSIEELNDDPKERTAAMSLIKTRSAIYNLGGRDKEDYSSDLEYELRLSHAGRGRDRPIPLSLWPTILERAYEKAYGIYDDWVS